MKIRYIRDWSNGNTNGANNNWNEICAYDYNNINVALGKTVTPSKAGTNDASVVTDGNDNVSFTFSGLGNVVVDLGGIYDIDRIRIRRFFPNGNTTTQYHETKTEVSINGQDWVTVFDCTVEGKYYETSEGKRINLKKDIDKLEDSATLKDVKNKVAEIENSLQATKDYFKDTLIDKDIECSDTEGVLNLVNKVKNLQQKKIASGTVVIQDEYLTLSYLSSGTFPTKACIQIDFPFEIDFLYVYEKDNYTGIMLTYNKFTNFVTTSNIKGDASSNFDRTYKLNIGGVYINSTNCKLGIHDGTNSSTNGSLTGKELKWIAIG